MEERNGDGSNAGKRNGEEAPRQEAERGGKRLRASIAAAAFSCAVCALPLRPPIFECSGGPSFVCSPCRDKLPGNRCQLCAGGCPLHRSHGMERAVQAVLVDCRYSRHGCAQRTAYHLIEEHEAACPHGRSFCPETGCGFVARAAAAAELLDHFTSRHGWPATEFQYWTPFDLRVTVAGVHVLRSRSDGQLFVAVVQAAADPPGGLAISVVVVPPYANPDVTTGFGCSVHFECSGRHRGTSTLIYLRRLSKSDWPPTGDYLCVLPKVWGLQDQAAGPVVLTLTIVCADEAVDEDDDDSSYVESEEDSDHCS